MGFSAFEIEEWGPPKLREIHKQIETRINENCPVEGLGIRISQDPTGRRIEAAAATPQGGDQNVSSGGGTSVDLAGMLNGAPAIFHLLQSSAPTALEVPP